MKGEVNFLRLGSNNQKMQQKWQQGHLFIIGFKTIATPTFNF